jgi:hypothetical protein
MSAPLQMHLAIASRDDPLLALSRLRGASGLRYVRPILAYQSGRRPHC